jgi:methyltransferase (TIGR00027 family)
MALFRAIESAKPADERLFADPFAAAFLTGLLKVASAFSRFPAGRRVILTVIDRRWPGPRPSAVIRTRIIDDVLAESLSSGAAQVVILGAGFDSRAYRIPGIDIARVFELDHPATQRAKIVRLKRVLRRTPNHVAYVPIDFEYEDLVSCLERAGFRADEAATFIWEGVTNYLSAAAVDHTIRSIARVTVPHSRLIFTYVHKGVLDGSVDFDEADRWVQAVRARGEPWTFGFDPTEVGPYLQSRGFDMIRDRSMLEASDELIAQGIGFGKVRGSALYRVAVAERAAEVASDNDAGRR